jgi:glyoxalase family protein
MKLDGLHHITMITGDAQRNVNFYGDLLGLRLVKQTVNFDQPEAYHLYFGDETGSPGSILTWFEFAGAPRGRAGSGMIHTIQLGVTGTAALDFWAARLSSGGVDSERGEDTLRFRDYDGLAFELVVAEPANPPLVAVHPEVPAAHAIVGAQGARAYGADPAAAAPLLTETLGFAAVGEGEYRLVGEHRRFAWAYDAPATEAGRQGAGTVHHIAWASRDEDHLAWQQRARDAGAAVTEVRDRDYFKSIYFREPRGILFEIATLSPGFAVDEDPAHLGESLRLPAMHEHLRAQLEHTLVPLVNPRAQASPTRTP